MSGRGGGRRRHGGLLAAVLLVGACSGTAEPTQRGDGALGGPVDVSVSGTLPLSDEALDDPEVTTVATDLAPSQVAGSTVPEPATPEPCTLADVELWTARVVANPPIADAVIRITNVGDEWCEPDIGRSPLLDPAVEPDVWLGRGEAAELVVGQQPGDCSAPSVVSLVQVGIGEESTVVPGAVVTCGWWLTAFYPLSEVRNGCDADQLAVAATELAIVMTNVSTAPCGVSGPVGAEGIGVVDRDPAAPRAVDLQPGDVVAIGRVDAGADCSGASVTIVDEVAGELRLDDAPCGLVVELGAPRPWVGAPDGPFAGAPGASLEADVALDLLDPFG